MIVNLIKSQQMFSFTLPQKIKGQFWISDLDEKEQERRLVSVEANNNKWILKSNKKVSIFGLNSEKIQQCVLNYSTIVFLKIESTGELVRLFVEAIDETRQVLKKIIPNEPCLISIGRTENSCFCFNDDFVSTNHATLAYDGENWSITDNSSKNGTFVNGYRITSKKLSPGDYIYIMGLKIIVGGDFFAVNNPDGKLKIRSNSLSLFSVQEKKETKYEFENIEKKYFCRSPRFHREIECVELKIDPPPQAQKADEVPLALMIGPSITMGIASVSTGAMTIMNSDDILRAIPTLLMSFSMLLGTVLWPILTKKYEKKKKIENEQIRQEKYIEYLNEFGNQIRSIAKEQCEILNENFISQEECVERIIRQKNSLWERVLGQKDFLNLRIGIGTIPINMTLKYPEKKFTMEDDNLQKAMIALSEEPKVLRNVPISLSIVENIAIGIFGKKTDTLNLLKALVLQMISLHSYDELKIILITDERDQEEWNFVKYIPHFWNEDKTLRFLALSSDDIKVISSFIEKNVLCREDRNNVPYSEYSPYYVLISTSSKLSKKCNSLTKLLSYKNNVGFSAIFLGDNFSDFPKETKTVIHANGNNSKLYDKDDTSGAQVVFDVEKSNPAIFDSIALKIANTELDLSNDQYMLPSMITFLDMFNVGKVEHLNVLNRWKENNPTQSLKTPVGIGADGDLFVLDLHEKYHGPHGLIAGMTGSGKSEFIITYILSMAVNYHPDEISFILIDYKGGGIADAFKDDDKGIKLPHLAGTITNLDGASIKRSLVSIQSELRRRQAIFSEARKVSNEGTMDIYKYQQLYRDRLVKEPLPHLFIISDEFAELKTQQPEFMEQLISAARIGRSLGVHLVLATQKPSGVVDDQIWSNSKFRVCLKVQEKADSHDMIKCNDAAELSQTGRFYLQVGFNELFAMGQSAWCGAEYIPTDVVEKAVDSSIQVVDNLGRVIMNVNPIIKQQDKINNPKQIVSIVKYLSELAKDEHICTKTLWLDPIAEFIYVDDLEKKYSLKSTGLILNPIVGEYDDPLNQKQEILTIPFSKEGNCLLYGSTGNGKTLFLTTMCYSLIKHHSANELNMYLLDFGAETLKSFEAAPQVGAVITSNDDEKTINLFKLLKKELETRKSLFSEYGGDYLNYCQKSKDTVPNIIVVINNFSAFSEQHEDLLESFAMLTRDCVKYGMYFIVSANSTNAVRYKILQNFKMLYSMQLNDPNDYSIIFGKTDGLIPSDYKGRGLVHLNKVFEFQTAYCTDNGDISSYIREYCLQLKNSSNTFARRVPILPKFADFSFVSEYIKDFSSIPVGVSKNTLKIETYNLQNKVVLPIISQDISDTVIFTEELIRVLSKIGITKVVDVEHIISSENLTKLTNDEFVVDIFNEMVSRNNIYADSDLTKNTEEAFDDRIYVFVGIKRFFDSLSDDPKDKFNVLLEKAELVYKMRFVFIDTANQINAIPYSVWVRKLISNSDGIWVGDGFADQYILKPSKITNELYDEIGQEYGYLVTKNKPTRIKLLSSSEREEI